MESGSLMKIRGSVIAKFFSSEKGTVESALVIVPLMLLFLGSLQIMAVISSKNLERTLAQDRARNFAMGIDSNSASNVRSSLAIKEIKTFWYLDKLQMGVVSIEKEIPKIFPGISNLIGGKKIAVSGASVIEQLP